jgi:hypothetical protein
MRIAFVGTYPPCRCGIATFTRDLARAVASTDERAVPMAIALTDPTAGYAYPPEVKYEIRQGAKGDYARAAEFVNHAGVSLVSIQHEHGIFGGDDGAYLLDLLAGLRVHRLGLPLYDFVTGGCRDGLGSTQANQNQGAESTISFLLALLQMLELAGEGLEHAGN